MKSFHSSNDSDTFAVCTAEVQWCLKSKDYQKEKQIMTIFPLRVKPTRRFWKDRCYNRPSTADYSADYSAVDPVGMAYQLGNWPTITGRPESPGDGRPPTYIKHV